MEEKTNSAPPKGRKPRPPHKPWSIYRCTITIIILFSIFMLLLSRFSSLVSDLYASLVHPIVVGIFARLTSLVSFSIGEFLIVLTVIFLLLSLPIYIVIKKCDSALLPKLKNVFAKTYSALTAFVIATMTLNCAVMYNCTPFAEEYLSESPRSLTQYARVYNILVENANRLATKVQRDDDGFFSLSGDLQADAKTSMASLGSEYSRLDGYYPDAKPIYDSFFMSQLGISGVFYPFTLEANYNNDMLDSNKPFTVCHELAHLRGYMNEDEANFIAYIACIGSDNVGFQYSGYISALEHFVNAMPANIDATLVEPSNEVMQDMFTFMPVGYWEENESKEVISTEIVSDISSAANDTYLKANGVEDGAASYNRVTELILDYYG